MKKQFTQKLYGMVSTWLLTASLYLSPLAQGLANTPTPEWNYLTVTNGSLNTVNLSWLVEPGTYVEGVYRSTSENEGFTQLTIDWQNEVHQDVTYCDCPYNGWETNTYTDRYDLQPGTTYFYKILYIHFNTSETFYSELESATTPGATPTISKLVLVDSKTNTETELIDGMVLTEGKSFNIRAIASPDVTIVAFEMDGVLMDDRETPFYLFNSKKGTANARNLSNGSHVLTASPVNAQGKEGNLIVVNFSISEGTKTNSSTVTLQIYPNPVVNRSTIKLTSVENGFGTIHLCDDRGNLLMQIYQGDFGSSQDFDIDAGVLRNGVYYLTAVINGKTYQQRLVVKH
jgi:hypothetical protein